MLREGLKSSLPSTGPILITYGIVAVCIIDYNCAQITLYLPGMPVITFKMNSSLQKLPCFSNTVFLTKFQPSVIYVLPKIICTIFLIIYFWI